MQQFNGIIRLYIWQFAAQFRTARPRAQILGAMIMLVVLGCLLGTELPDRLFPDGRASLDFAALAAVLGSWCKVQLGLNLLIMPHVLFTVSQIEEMAGCTRFPVAPRRLAVLKYLDLCTVLILWNVFLQAPMILGVFSHARGLYDLVQYTVLLGSYVVVLHLLVCASLSWSVLGCGLLLWIPAARVRPLLVILAWNALPLIFALMLVVPGIGESLPLLPWLTGPLSVIFRAVFSPQLSVDLLGLGLLLAAGGAGFSLMRLVVGRYYVAPIHALRDRMLNRCAMAATGGRRWVLPLIPRPIQALCRKDLRLCLRSYEFWLFLFLGLVPALLVVGLQLADDSKIDASGTLHLVNELKSVVLFPVAFLLLHVGLWTFRYENENCQNLQCYPVPPRQVALGKGLAVFLLLLPLSAAWFLLDPGWFRSAPFGRLLFVLAYLYMISVSAAVVGGATLNYTGRTVMDSITWSGRGVLLIVLGICQAGFWLVMSAARVMPEALLAGTALCALLTWLVAGLTAQLVPGFHRDRRAAALSLPVSTAAQSCPHSPTHAASSVETAARNGRGYGAPNGEPPGPDTGTVAPRRPWRCVVAATLLALPLGAAALYVFAGVRGFRDFPVAWQFGFILVPLLLGILMALPRRCVVFRGVVFGLLVVGVPGIAALLFGHSQQPLTRALIYPVRLGVLANIAIEQAAAGMIPGESRPHQDPTPPPLPPELVAAIGCPDGWTINDLVARTPPPASGTIRPLVESLPPSTFGYESGTDLTALSAWLRTNLTQADFDDLAGPLLLSMKETRVRRPPLENFCMGLLGKTAPQMRAADNLPLLVNALIDNCSSESIAARLDWNGLTTDQEELLLAVLQSAAAAPPEVPSRKGGLPMPGQVRRPEKGKEAVFYLNSFLSGTFPQAKFLARLHVPAAFDCAQYYTLQSLAPELRELFPPDSALVRGTDSITADQVVALATSRPCYAAFLLVQHPCLRHNPELSARALRRLLQTDPSMGDFVFRVFADCRLPEAGRLLLKDMGFQGLAPIFPRQPPKSPGSWQPQFFSVMARDDEVGRTLGSWAVDDPQRIAELVTTPAVPNSVRDVALAAAVASCPNPDDLWYPLAPLVTAQPPPTALSRMDWRSVVAALPPAEQTPAAVALLRIGVPQWHALPPEPGHDFNRAMPASVPGPEARNFIAALMRDETCVVRDLTLIRKTFQFLWNSGEHAQARLWLVRHAALVPDVALLLQAVDGTLLQRDELFLRCASVSDPDEGFGVQVALRLTCRNDEDRLALAAWSVHPDGYLMDPKPMKQLMLRVNWFHFLFAWPLLVTALFWLAMVATGALVRVPVPAALPGGLPPVLAETDEEAAARLAARRLPGLRMAFALLGVVVAVQIAAGIFAATSDLEMTDPLLLTVFNVLALGLPLLIGVKSAGLTWAEALPLKRFSPHLLAPLLLFTLGAGILASECDNLLRLVMPPPEFLTQAFQMLSNQGWRSMVVLMLCAPLTEEPLFRGLLLRGFVTRYGAHRAIVYTALLFGLIHLNPYQFIPALMVGIFFGWLRLSTGSLWPCILGHAAFNSLGLLTSLIPGEIPGLNRPGALQPLWLDALGLLLAAVGLYAMRRRVMQKQP